MQKRTSEVEVRSSGKKMLADMWIASDHFNELRQPLLDETDNVDEWIVETILGESAEEIFHSLTPEEQEYVYLWGELIKKPRLGCLAAHGDDEHGRWIYYDGRRKGYIQSWLNAHDGHYAALICRCCNTGSLTPQTKHSLLVLPDTIYSGARKAMHECRINVVHPHIGELDQYIIECELEKLRARLQA